MLVVFCNRIYISGDTLLVPELHEIPKRYAGQNIDLMLVHLGGTTVPSPSVPLAMITMDAEQGLGLVRLIGPDLTIPIHYEYVQFPLPQCFKGSVLSSLFLLLTVIDPLKQRL